MRWRAIVVVLAAGVLAAPVWSAPATAEPHQERMDELRAALGHASEEEAAVLAELGEARSGRQQAEARLRAVQAEAGRARAAADRARAEREAAAAEYLALREQVAATEAELEIAKGKFETASAAMYRGAGTGATGPSLIFELNPEDMEIAQRYLADTSRHHRHDADAYLAAKEELERQEEALADQRALAAELAELAESEEARAEALVAEQTAARDAAEAAEAAEAAVLTEIQERKDVFSEELQRLEEESARLRAQFQSSGEGTAPGALLRPVDAPITSGFGPRVHPITGAQRMHNGVDFGAAHGTPVRAGEAGTVDHVVSGCSQGDGGCGGGFGNFVIVDHGGGLQTLYAHLSTIGVGVGAQVARGQIVGGVGSTGASTGPHLHWEVWSNGTPVNPTGYL